MRTRVGRRSHLDGHLLGRDHHDRDHDHHDHDRDHGHHDGDHDHQVDDHDRLKKKSSEGGQLRKTNRGGDRAPLDDGDDRQGAYHQGACHQADGHGHQVDDHPGGGHDHHDGRGYGPGQVGR